MTASKTVPRTSAPSTLITTSAVMLPILGCMNVAEMEGDRRYSLGSGRIWHGVSPEQERFLREILRFRHQTDGLSEDELRSIASDKAEELNAFLASQGFGEVRLEPFTGPHDFGMASVLKVGVKWHFPGTSTAVGTPHGKFPAARLKAGVNYFRAPQHPNPVASVACGNGDIVYMTELDEHLEGLDLVQRARDITGMLVADTSFGGLVFPKVNFDSKVDISWLLGLWTNDQDGRRATISQALQQTRFKMDHQGARTESAVALGVTRSMSMAKPDLVIGNPFLVVHTRPTTDLPIIAIRCCPDTWKDPGTF